MNSLLEIENNFNNYIKNPDFMINDLTRINWRFSIETEMGDAEQGDNRVEPENIIIISGGLNTTEEQILTNGRIQPFDTHQELVDWLVRTRDHLRNIFPQFNVSYLFTAMNDTGDINFSDGFIEFIFN
jgi:hypothetical protein